MSNAYGTSLKRSIEIVGQVDGSERQAAEILASVLQPHLNAASRVVIVVGARCFGSDIQDVDLLVLGTFGRGIEIGLGQEGSVRLINLALVIEVKGHPGDRIQFSGQHVHVEYRTGWEDATQKAFRQAKQVRRRVEIICKRLVASQKYAEKLGDQLLIFRGRAGSGKTIYLLRLARDLFDRGDRVLILTFNKALVADVRRLLRIIEIPDQLESGVRITTAHKFFIGMLTAWGLWSSQDNASISFPVREYQEKKQELLQLIHGETVNSLKEELFLENGLMFSGGITFWSTKLKIGLMTSVICFMLTSALSG